jgi:transposase
MNNDATPVQRVIGFDSHPDSFTAALLRGPTPAAAVTEKTFNKVPISQLESWAKKHTTAEDLFVLEASGNSFQVVRSLAAVGRQARVLESCHIGKLKEAHANNDKISAVRIGKAFLAGTAKEVWVPDPKTQEWRDLFHAHGKCVKRTTQMCNRILSYLSDHGVRLTTLTQSQEEQQRVLQAYSWSVREKQVIDGYFMDWRHAEEQRAHWQSVIAQEVLAEPVLLSLVRLCGIRDQVAFAVGAIIGDIKRFANPRKLVGYIGLNPAFDDSGEQESKGGIGGHGRRDLRSLLIQSAQSILRSNHPLAKWGRKLSAKKNSVNLAVAAIARRLVVSIWYLMMGRWTPLEEIDERLALKVGKIITRVGANGLKKMDKTRKTLREETYQSLKAGRVYALDPTRKLEPKPKPKVSSLAVEYGLVQ